MTEGGEGAGRAAVAAGAGRRGVVVALIVAAAGLLVLYAPFLVAAGPGRVWEALVVQAGRDGEWWRLPFPPEYGGTLRAWPPAALAADLKDVAAWLAPFAALLVLIAGVPRRAVAGLTVLGLGATVYYLSRADLEHAQALLVVAVVIAAAAPRPRLVLGAVLALLLAVGVANRASALLRPPDLAPLHVPGAAGVRVPPEDAQALPRVVALTRRLVPPGQPIYVAPRRSDVVTFSDPLLHFLTRRPNVLRRDVLLQAKPEEQRRIVGALQRARPKAVIRWTAPESAQPEPNRRGRPSGSRALDAYLAAAYHPVARYGEYEILTPR